MKEEKKNITEEELKKLRKDSEKQVNDISDKELNKIAGGLEYETDGEWVINGKTNELEKKDNKKND